MPRVTKNSALLAQVVCAVFFLSFTFLYLYVYQGDILAVTQHALSHGRTHYDVKVGAVLITLILWLVQIGVYTLTGLRRHAHALTYLPSLLLLGVLTHVSPSIVDGEYLGVWKWLLPLLLIVYAFAVWVVRQLETLEMPVRSDGIFSRMTWANMLQMLVMCLIVCGIGCSDVVFHYRARVEHCIMRKDYSGAAKVGYCEAVTDSSLTLARIVGLTHTGSLAEHLFDYPLLGGSDAMLPNGSSVRLLMVPEKRLYATLGLYFKDKMRPIEYLERLHDCGRATQKAHDWLLCAYLLDGRLDDFVARLPKYYKIDDSLPKSYREALVLYNHLRRQPALAYHNTLMEADYADFRRIGLSKKNPQERYAALRDVYGKTYWLYYMKLVRS